MMKAEISEVIMKNLAEQFDGLNELIYVSDRESYELLFLNKCGLQVFGYDDFRQVKGKKCYEVFREGHSPVNSAIIICYPRTAIMNGKETTSWRRAIFF